jgi:hypothetical protein
LAAAAEKKSLCKSPFIKIFGYYSIGDYRLKSGIAYKMDGEDARLFIKAFKFC